MVSDGESESELSINISEIDDIEMADSIIDVTDITCDALDLRAWP